MSKGVRHALVVGGRDRPASVAACARAAPARRAGSAEDARRAESIGSGHHGDTLSVEPLLRSRESLQTGIGTDGSPIVTVHTRIRCAGRPVNRAWRRDITGRGGR